MEMEITVPHEIPVMTLPQVVFFPQALLPLHIFEPRYRQMLADVLSTDRLFAVAQLDVRRAARSDAFEPLHQVASIGIVRACQGNSNGTSNLLLQGLCRVQVRGIIEEEPYRRIRVRPLASTVADDNLANVRRRNALWKLIAWKQKLGAIPEEMADFLRHVNDPDTFVDLAASTLCDNAALKQQLLETLDVGARLELFSRRLRHDIEKLRLRQRLQGGLDDDQIAHN